MYKIRIYTKSGNQIELWVKEFTVTPSAGGYDRWSAKFVDENFPQILALSPSQIEAVIILEEK